MQLSPVALFAQSNVAGNNLWGEPGVIITLVLLAIPVLVALWLIAGRIRNHDHQRLQRGHAPADDATDDPADGADVGSLIRNVDQAGTIRFLPPIPTDDLGERPWRDPGLVQTIAHDVRQAIQDELYEMVGQRRSVWFG